MYIMLKLLKLLISIFTHLVCKLKVIFFDESIINSIFDVSVSQTSSIH
jgi:hypothetical protein